VKLWNRKRINNKVKITTIHFIAGLWFVAFPLSTGLTADVTLTVGSGAGPPGSTDASLEVSLDNPNDPVRSIQMDVCDPEGYLACTGCEPTERASEFLCTSEEQGNGCCRIIFIDIGGASIIEGAGSVFVIAYNVSEDAPSEECINLNPQGISIRDENKELLEVTAESGEFCFETPSTTTTTAPSIEILENPIWKSRWVPIPYLMVIEGKGTDFVPFQTSLSFEPALVIVPSCTIVWDSLYIWSFIWVMPAWLAGFDDQSVTIEATTDDMVAAGNVEVNLLPFILNNPKH
jgi:hypothetical protein